MMDQIDLFVNYSTWTNEVIGGILLVIRVLGSRPWIHVRAVVSMLVWIYLLLLWPMQNHLHLKHLKGNQCNLHPVVAKIAKFSFYFFMEEFWLMHIQLVLQIHLMCDFALQCEFPQMCNLVGMEHWWSLGLHLHVVQIHPLNCACNWKRRRSVNFIPQSSMIKKPVPFLFHPLSSSPPFPPRKHSSDTDDVHKPTIPAFSDVHSGVWGWRMIVAARVRAHKEIHHWSLWVHALSLSR